MTEREEYMLRSRFRAREPFHVQYPVVAGVLDALVSIMCGFLGTLAALAWAGLI